MNNPQQQEPLQFPQSQPVNQPSPRASLTDDGPKVFYYIAGISLINSILLIFNFGFYGSLAITMLVTGIAMSIAQSVNGGIGVTFMINAVAFVINAAIAGIVAGFGWLAGKGHAWVYVLGMIAYTLDGILMGFLGDWLEVLVHLYVLYLLWRGWSALRKVNKEVAKSEFNSPSVID